MWFVDHVLPMDVFRALPTDASSCFSDPRGPRPETRFLLRCLAGGMHEFLPVWLHPPLFKRPQRLCVLSMVARPRYQLDITVLVQHPIHGRFVKRDCEFLIEPLCQVDQPPATTPWISGIGPLSTIALSASRWASMSLGRLPVALPLISP